MAQGRIKVQRHESSILNKLEETGKVIGEGSYGRVVEMKDKKSGKVYAAKELHSLDSLQYRSVMENYERIAKFRHPNIVEFCGFIEHGSRTLLVMEKMEESLTAALERSDIQMAWKIAILLGVAEGLNYLHSQPTPVVHGGLSSNNILLNQKNKFEVKISDVGIATMMTVKSPPSNLSRELPADFLPPDTQLCTVQKGLIKWSPSLDMFSYGAVVLHTVTQQWPKPQQRSFLIETISEETSNLKMLIINCMNDDQEKRPSMVNALETIKKVHDQMINSAQKIDIENQVSELNQVASMEEDHISKCEEQNKLKPTVELDDVAKLDEENKLLKKTVLEKEAQLSKLKEENKILKTTIAEKEKENKLLIDAVSEVRR